MATRMQQRRGDAEQWLLADPVLAAGEIGFETDTGSFKLGDGVSHWIDLDYFETTVSLQGTLDDYVPLSQKGAPLGVAELDENGFVPASQLDIDVSGDINAAVSALIGGAPELLDTLNELAAAIGDDANFITTINSNITSGDAATLASAETFAGIAESNAITTASADASAKASAAQSAAISAAAVDASTKADAAEAAANIYTDGRETAITTAYQTYADNAETAAISSASTDATTKANAAETNSKSYTDSLIGDATVDGTSGNTVAARIDAAVSGLVDSAPGLLDTLNEIAAAIGDDPDFITSIGSTITAGDTATLTSANSYTDTRETAITTAYQGYADTAESDAVSAASADATTKANAAQAAAEATASADATSKANAAESSANAYTDGEISTLDTSLKAYADQTYVDADARNAVSAGDGLGYDSLTGVFSAELGFGLAIDVNGNISVDGSIISTDQDVANLIGDVTVNGTAGNTVTDRISSAVSGLVDSAPATLDTLNELAAALGDDANFATTVSTQIGGKADAVHTHLIADVTDITATATELNYVDGVTSSIQAQLDNKLVSSDLAGYALETYADTAEADAITSANSYTDGRETAITTAYQSYADTAEADAISSSATDATTKANAAEAAANTYTDGRETAIITAYQAYADQAEADAISSAASDATTKATAAEVNAESYADSLIGDATVDGTAGNTVTARISSAVAGLVDTAPEALNTLNELAAALNDDANFATTVTNSLAAKAPLASPTFTGTVDFSSATVQGLEIPQPIHPFSMIG